MAGSEPGTDVVDIAIVGAGAAGLATAIYSARQLPGRRVVVLDAARKPGAKILVSGGGRCNVTNVRVTANDFHGGSRNVVRRILSAFPETAAASFFRELGVGLHEEEHGKLFPDSSDAHTVLAALLAEAQRLNVEIRSGWRVEVLSRAADAFELRAPAGAVAARCVVLATGGLSLPKTGSDGSGFALAQALGHSLTPTTPALDPLLLDGEFHKALSGIAHPAELTIAVEGEKPIRVVGALLWTHFGMSGPVVLDASRHWHRARLLGRRVEVHLNFVPGEDFAALEAKLQAVAIAQPRVHLHNALSTLLPARVANALLGSMGMEAATPLAHLARDVRRRLINALLKWPLPVVGGRGYNFAEVTAGGVPLDEIDPRTMESRTCPGLFLVGEILDVDGRLGGFNFQWAWSSAFVAAGGIARRAAESNVNAT
jgi:predicted Rossmann fold flavoprotein